MNQKRKMLAEYQAQLLVLLEGEENLVDVKRKMLKDERFFSLREYSSQMRTEMLEVARELVRKWGRKC